MRWFSKLSIRSKMMGAFMAVLTLIVFLGVFSLWKLAAVNQTSTDMEVNWLPSVRYVGEITADLSRFRRAELEHILSLTKPEMDAQEQRMSEVLANLEKTQKAYEPLISSEEEKKTYVDFQQQWREFLGEHEKILQLSRANKNEEAKALARGAAQKELADAEKATAKLVEINVQGGIDASHTGDALYASSRWWIAGVIAGAVALGLFLAFYMAGLVSSGVRQAAAAAERIASGDLSGEPLHAASEDEIGDLILAINKMQRNLGETIQSISNSAIQVGSASEELSATSQQITANSEETSAQARVVSDATLQVSQNLQTVATGAEEMGASIKEIAKNATEAAKIAT